MPRKAILLLDNAPTHPSEDELRDGEIKMMFLPPNVMSICQPMDQGVLETIKRNYHRQLLSSLIDSIDQGENMIEKLCKINLKDVAYFVAQSWESVGAGTIAKSWNVLLGEKPHSEEFASEDNDGVLPLLKQIPAKMRQLKTSTNGLP